MISVLGGRIVADALAVGVGHKAKTLCSGVFVSGRDAAAVLDDLHIDDLAILRYFSAIVEPADRAVTASAFGILTRRAVFRPGLGCSLVLEGMSPPALPGGTELRSAPAGATPALVPLAPGEGDAGHLNQLRRVVARAFTEPHPQRPRRTRAVVVVHRGTIMAEEYAVGVGPHTPLPGWSMSKSVMNAFAGILVKEGRLSLHAPVRLPEWQGDEGRASITLDHLLRMSSGLRVDEGMTGPQSDAMRMLFGRADVAAFAAGKRLAYQPGTHWKYSNGTTNILSRVLRNVLRDETEYLTFPRRALFDRIGMTSAVMETDATGTFVGSSYTYATARDWARFGQLYLHDGVWNGERLLPEGWIAYTASPAPADGRKQYGAHFWVQVPDEYAGTNPNIPAPALHAAGHEGQFVTIVPEHDLVIVRLGRTRYAEGWDQAAFVREVMAALPGSVP